MEKSVTEAINFRRSVRKFDPNKEIDSKIVKKCIENAVLAPTSSNLQLWEFFHITDKELLIKLSKTCFSQPAASTAKQIIVVVTRKDLWKKRANQNINFFDSKRDELSEKQYNLTRKYYNKAVPLVYKDFLGIFSYLKYLFANFLGLFRPPVFFETDRDAKACAKADAIENTRIMCLHCVLLPQPLLR